MYIIILHGASQHSRNGPCMYVCIISLVTSAMAFGYTEVLLYNMNGSGAGFLLQFNCLMILYLRG